MTGPKTRPNPLLVIVAILLCLGCGATFSRSSANPSPLDEDHMLDVILAENTDSSQSDNSDISSTVIEKPTETPIPEEPTETPVPEPTAIPTAKPEKNDYVASPEASIGIWTPSGSNWLFLVDGVAYKGWLYDTDEKIYYLNDSGIMVTGWKDIGDKRYYFNLDGILQTGDVIYKERTYHLMEDGSLEGYSVSEAAEKKKAKAAEEAEADKSSDDTEKSDSGEDTKDTEQTNSDKNTKDTEKADSKKKENVNDEETAKNEQQKEKTAKTSDGKDSSATEKKTVALTFDDGPSSFTNRLLDCLEANDVKATFFLVGYEIDSFPDEVKRMEKLGMEIGNHTAEHADLTTLSAEDIQSQINRVNAQLNELVGHDASALRPPYGAVNDLVKENASLPMILWSIDTLDWESKNAEKIVDTVLSEVADGSIILMHDIYSTTVDAVEIMIPELIAQGYELVTVHELAEEFGITLENGVTYNAMQ